MNPPHGLWVMIARRRHITSSTCNDPRCSFNPLRIGEAAPPCLRAYRSSARQGLLFQSPSHRGGGIETSNPTSRHIAVPRRRRLPDEKGIETLIPTAGHFAQIQAASIESGRLQHAS